MNAVLLIARLAFAGIFVVLVGIASGCGALQSARLVPVKGKVTYNRAPLKTGSLVFKPNAEKGNTSKLDSASSIGADGSYSLFTAEKEGAPLGWYKVGVVAQEANANDPYAIPKSLVPSKYQDANTSELEIEVVERPTAGAYDLSLK